ncbi:MAG: enoyl-CoA hydratase/isomerase family protein [Rhodospirillales bacterium]|nr:enoyl-CoA hydratase/isomerase family protein [Rhodospirillales bacterium]
MSDLVTLEKRGAIGLILVNYPPVNALCQGVRKGLLENAQAADEDAGIKAIVIAAQGRTFMAGADITEFGNPAKANPTFHDFLNVIEACGKPVVAAIHGTAFGGGMETALACHYRIAVPSAQVGLPEVKLGILPGAGGTQRLPRLIGPEEALPIIISGDPVPASRALELGILDAIVDGDLIDDALAYAEKLVADGAPLRKVRDMDDKVAAARGKPEIFDNARKHITKVARGYFAPERIVQCVEAAVNLPFDEGIKRERELIMECMASTESKGMIHTFFSERLANKIPDVPADTPTLPVKSLAVIGAGTMGGGIAMSIANAGLPVHLLELSQDALDRGLETIRKNYASTVKKGRLSQEKMDQRMALITPTTNYDDIAQDDFIIEAVFEDMGVKKEVFAKLDQVCKPDAILASNTSTLDVDEIASATKRPDKVIGTHFFSPANIMRLLEAVRGAASSKETIATTMKLGKTLRKVTVLAGNCDGFIGNRMVHRYGNQATFLLEEGALPEQVDRVAYDFGLPMGPLAMNDMAGLDVSWFIRKRKLKEGLPQGQRYSTISDKICEMGRFGQKTSGGYYHYDEGSRVPVPDPKIAELIVQTSAEAGVERRDISDDEIRKRLIYALVNEGAKLLEQGFALRSSDIDIIYIYGYGFPPYRGGPMFYADTVGLKSVYDDICALSLEHPGEGWEPAPLLKKLADEGKSFADL